jgi:hypothetical protein
MPRTSASRRERDPAGLPDLEAGPVVQTVPLTGTTEGAGAGLKSKQSLGRGGGKKRRLRGISVVGVPMTTIGTPSGVGIRE